MSDHKKKKRILKEFKLNEISAVDRPAQAPALAVIMKRNDDPVEVTKHADILTSIDKGHQHGVDVEVYDGQLYLYVGRALSEGEDENHNHEIVFNIQTGVYEISTNAGHKHDIDTVAIQTILVSRFSKCAGENTITKEKALTLTAAVIGGSKTEHTEEINMPDINKTDHDKALARIESLKKTLATAVAMGTMNDGQRAHYGPLDSGAQEVFLAKSLGERDAELAAIIKADEIVYTADDGTTFRKSADPAMVALVKRADNSDKELAKARDETVELNLEKRASTELKHLPGELAHQKALLKAVDGIEDEEIRKGVTAILKAHNAGLAVVTQEFGHQTVTKVSDNASAELDSLAKAYVVKNPETAYLDAYELVGDANPELYNKAVSG